jgi:hypothetical protein
VPEAGSLACKRECDGAGFKHGRSDWRLALFCTTSYGAERRTRSNSHTIDYLYTRKRHVTSRRRTNQLFPSTNSIQVLTRDDNQYRFHLITQIQTFNQTSVIWDSLVSARTRRRSTRGCRRIRRRRLARALVVAPSIKVAAAVDQVHTLAHTAARARRARGPSPRV